MARIVTGSDDMDEAVATGSLRPRRAGQFGAAAAAENTDVPAHRHPTIIHPDVDPLLSRQRDPATSRSNTERMNPADRCVWVRAQTLSLEVHQRLPGWAKMHKNRVMPDLTPDHRARQIDALQILDSRPLTSLLAMARLCRQCLHNLLSLGHTTLLDEHTRHSQHEEIHHEDKNRHPRYRRQLLQIARRRQ